MTQKEYKIQLSKYRSQKQKLFNDTYLWTTLAIQSLKIISNNDELIRNKSNFKVPSRKVAGKVIQRTPEAIKILIDNAANKELYFSIFTYLVAQFEGFLVDTITLVLKFDTRRLRINVQGGDNNKKIDIAELLECTNYESIVELIIERQLGSLFYAGPKKQVEYLEKVLLITIDEELWNKWFEYKATRDIIVHNSSQINKIYIEKAGVKSRGLIGQQITVSNEYFEDALITLKSLIGKIVVQASKITL